MRQHDMGLRFGPYAKVFMARSARYRVSTGLQDVGVRFHARFVCVLGCVQEFPVATWRLWSLCTRSNKLAYGFRGLYAGFPFFPVFWDHRTVMFQLSGFYSRGF